MAITPLPTPAPSRTQTESEFVAASNALFGALPNLVTEINDESAAIDADRVAAAASAASAAAQVVLATDEADRAETAADIAVGAANFRGEYSAGTTYQIGQSVSYLGGVFIAKTVNLGVTPVDGANWLDLSPTPAGYTQIGSDVATTSGSTVTFANIPADYSDLLFEFVDVSPSTTAAINITLSDNGVNYTASRVVINGVGASDTIRGQVSIARYQGGNFAVIPNLVSLASNRTIVGSGSPSPGVCRLDAPLTHVRFSVDTGNFDAGSIRLFGR